MGEAVMADDERRAEIEAYKRANERLETALLHVINRVSTEGRDDEHKHLFIVGSEAVKHAKAELDRVRDARGDDEVPRCNVPGCIRLFGHDGGCEYGAARSPQSEDHEGLARALERVLGRIDTEEAAANAVEAVCRALGYRPDAAPSRDGSVAVEDVERWLRDRASPNEHKVADAFVAEFSPASTGDQAPDGQ